ncbi:MAG: adenylate/guanylate cyclase domain-containing protein, partial [Bacteroidota bacterium]
MDARKQRFFLKVLPYPIISLVSGLLYFGLELGLLGNLPIYPTTGNPYQPWTSVIMTTIMTLLLGIVLGMIEEGTFKQRFRTLRFSYKILAKTVVYVLLFVVTLGISALVLNAINLNLPLWAEPVYQTVGVFFASFTFVSLVIYGASIIGVSLFFSEIVDFLGIDIVGNFFTGKYATPVVENRIFMFLDMKDSTTIAERLGHQQHYRLINEYYGDMTAAIVQTHGTIYQYVGDEIVISWDLHQGLTNSNCLACFYLIAREINRRADHYQHTYGVVPAFKAGLHCGEVTRGQIGQIKRD